MSSPDASGRDAAAQAAVIARARRERTGST